MTLASLLALAAAATLAAGDGTAGPDDPPARKYHGRERELEVQLPRLDLPVQVDGMLDEPVWARAARLTGFSQYAPADDVPAADSTEVLVWYSAHAIHFGVRAWAEPGTVRASLGDRDKSYNDDYIGIFLATQADRRQATVFAVNPLGVQGDGILVEGQNNAGGGFGGAQIGREPTDVAPDYVFQSKGRLTDYGFEVEIRIPFRSLQFRDAEKQSWAINVLRRVQSRGEEHSWAPARRAAASYIAQFGHLADLENLDRGRVLDVTPIVTMRAAGAAPAAGDGWEYDTRNPQFGANVRYGLTSSLTLSATLRPDFAEVESDAGQAVSDPRMLLYFPDKRPFFLEGAEQFAVPANLIYTRRIADPRVAAKVTGTVAGAQTAMLVARESRTSSITGDGHPLFTWLRSTRTVGGDSRIGVLYTGREDDGASNRVAAADARLVFGGVYAVQALAALSRNEAEGDVRTAPLFRLEASRNGRSFVARYLFTSIANDFQTASGFISRDSIARVNVDHGYTIYGPAGGWWQTASADLVLDGTWRYSRFVDGGDAIEKKLHLNTNYVLRGGWRLGASVLVETFGFDPDYYGRYAVERHTASGVDTVPFTGTPRIPNLDWLVQAQTPNFQHVSANAFYLWGHDENFFEWASASIQWLTLGVDWRPTTQLRVSQTYNMQSYRRRTDGSLVASTHIPRLKVEYQFNRALQVRAVGEYFADQVDSLRDDSRTGDPLLVRTSSGGYRRMLGGKTNQFRPQLLLAWTPVPGTVFYAGYDATVADPEAWRFRRMQRERDGVFVKASYLFRL
jgi:hypothetical protein